MPYLLHPPRHFIVFATNDEAIFQFLRHKHRWVGHYTERTILPDYIVTSCIRELRDGTVEIEAKVLYGEDMAEEIEGMLRRDGYVEPDLRFVGRLVHDSQGSNTANEVNVKEHDEAEITSWDGDGLDGSRAPCYASELAMRKDMRK